MDSNTEKKLWAKVLTLIAKPKMKERQGDKYFTRKRPRNAVNACELYTDNSLGVSEAEAFHFLNTLVQLKRVEVQNLSYVLKR